MSILVDHVLGEGGSIATSLEGFEPRPQQIDMAKAVESSLSHRRHLMVEAGTGIGKSFAYLVPLIRRIQDHGERVVVATNTINLQEQLLNKDIPILEKALGGGFHPVLVKGRGNYLSRRRLALAVARSDKLLRDDASRATLRTIQEWATTTQDGTRASLPVLKRPGVWDHVASDANNCMGRKCPTYQSCFYQQARREMEDGDLLICNHAVLFSDLALKQRGAGFLPAWDHLVIDEAHAAEGVASEHFGASLSLSRVSHLLDLLLSDRRDKGFLVAIDEIEHAAPVIECVERAREASVAFFETIIDWARREAPPNGQMRTPGVVPNVISRPVADLARALTLLKDDLESDADALEAAAFIARAEEIADDAAAILEQSIPGCVYWVDGMQPRADAAGRRLGPRPSLHCMPVEVGPILESALFSKDAGIVLTSATLATGAGDFSHAIARLGVKDPETMRVGSPFDHVRQMRTRVDPGMPQPNDEAYEDRVGQRLVELIDESDGGLFALFTSFKMIRAVASLIRDSQESSQRPVLVHGEDGPPGRLLELFREDPRSVLLGTASFWQGVDVRGEGLRHVVITRLPFEVPDRPIVEARLARIKERGGNPFMDDQVPRAVIRFRQGVGRLIRSSSDQGLVTVLDPRIVTKPYGQKFLQGLPDGVEIEPLDPDF